MPALGGPDIGAIQRDPAHSRAAKTGYPDIGALQPSAIQAFIGSAVLLLTGQQFPSTYQYTGFGLLELFGPATYFSSVTSVGPLPSWEYDGLGVLYLDGGALYGRDRTYTGEGVLYLTGISTPSWRTRLYDGLGVLYLTGEAITRVVDFTITGLPDGYSAQVYAADDTLLGGAVSSMGVAQPLRGTGFISTSGHIQLYDDGAAYSHPAPFGRAPAAGDTGLSRGNIWAYHRVPYILTPPATSAYIARPFGGWTAPGSARIEHEEFGYATFADSALGGLGRGLAGTTAASHTGGLPVGAVAVWSRTGLLDVTSCLANVNSVPWEQDQTAIFANFLDELYVGASSKFAAVYFWLARNASERLRIYPMYSTGQGTWASFTNSSLIPLLDTTSGFTWSSWLGIEPPGDWTPTDRISTGSGTLADGASRYYLRLINLSNSAAVAPSLMDVTLTADTLITARVPTPFQYVPTVQDSGQPLYFKALAYSLTGALADGPSAPVAVSN